MRIGVTGGRNYAKLGKVVDTLKAIRIDDYPVLVHGGASGADRLAEVVADDLGWDLDPFKADWEGPCRPGCNHGLRRRRGLGTYCPQAGPNRNQDMVDSHLDILLAFPGGNGTEDMVRRAKAAGILVLRVED